MPDEIIRVHDQFYILATSTRLHDRTRVLKDGDTFAIFDRHGDISSLGLGEPGLYHEGTRFLSRFDIRFGVDRPLLLSSVVRRDNTLLGVDVANPDVSVDGGSVIPADTIHLFRSTFLHRGVCHQRLRLRNFALQPVELAVAVRYEADFIDIFEVRGMVRARRGRLLEPEVTENGVVLGYEGLDGVGRRTRLDFSPPPERCSSSDATLRVRLEPQGEATFYVTATCDIGGAGPSAPAYDTALAEVERVATAARAQDARVVSSNEGFNEWVTRSAADLRMMVTDTPEGPYPYAGVPWFSTVFGRDGIITALEYLWVNPALARGVLRFLARHQAHATRPEQDAEPGKIVHEMRRGEMAALGEIPFGTYYGTVDATPLFVMLAGAYFERTGDRELIDTIWPNVEQALAWIDGPGDPDGDGFVEYSRCTPRGLVNQGWKDSHDAISHADGTLAEQPIALAEVQGYVYAAKRAAARLAVVRGDVDRSRELARQARELRTRFARAFWLPDLGTYALALDGAKAPCRVRASNAGHLLYTGIAAGEHAAVLAATLLGPDVFSGWGVRTLGTSEVRYNPMSYHNGSVWPHDNALIAAGLARYGFKEAALAIVRGLFDASLFVDLHRLPELFCGFPRRPGEGPTLYPVACSPQSWAVGAVFLLLQACLGLSIRTAEKQIRFTKPTLPEFLREVQLHGLTVGSASADIVLRRHPHDVGVDVLRRSGEVEIVIVK